MFAIFLVMFVALANLEEGKASNMCDDVLAKDGIDKTGFVTAVAHTIHSLYLEPLRFFYFLESTPVLPKVCSEDHWWSARFAQVIHQSLYKSIL
jgi:hypothetical protein